MKNFFAEHKKIDSPNMIKFQTKSLVKHHLLQDFGLFKPGVAGVVSRKNHRHTLGKMPQFGGN